MSNNNDNSTNNATNNNTGSNNNNSNEEVKSTENKQPTFTGDGYYKDFEVPKGDEGYERKYDPEYNGYQKRSPYPSQKHRCDNYLEDVFYNFVEDRKLFWKSMSALWGCFRAEKGKEPPRTREEKWEI